MSNDQKVSEFQVKIPSQKKKKKKDRKERKIPDRDPLFSYYCVSFGIC